MYTYINDITQSPFQITVTNNQNNHIPLNIPTIDEHINYKYLGLNINLNLNFQDTINSFSNKYKEIISQIAKKKYLGLKLIIKLINTVAIPKISYIMNFIKWPSHILDNLDNFTTNTICKTFKIPLSPQINTDLLSKT